MRYHEEHDIGNDYPVSGLVDKDIASPVSWESPSIEEPNGEPFGLSRDSVLFGLLICFFLSHQRLKGIIGTPFVTLDAHDYGDERRRIKKEGR